MNLNDHYNLHIVQHSGVID